MSEVIAVYPVRYHKGIVSGRYRKYRIIYPVRRVCKVVRYVHARVPAWYD